MPSKIGVALFRDASPFSKNDNIACEYGGRPFYFGSTSDLPAQTLWVTNCDSDKLYEAGLSRAPSIASDGYFRTRLSQIVGELGLSIHTLEHQVAILAEILGSAAAMLKAQLGLIEYPAYGMAQAVGQLYGSQEPPKGSAMFQIAEQACQRYTACKRTRRHEQADVFSFWFPREQRASEMLELPLPTGDVKLVPMHSLPDMGKDPQTLANWAFDQKIPLFARIRIHGLDESVGELMSYGAGALDVQKSSREGRAYDARNFREWCALPELAFLASYGSVEVIQVAVASGWQNTGLRTLRSRLSAISYAYGLAAENLWVGTLRRNSGYFNICKSLSTAWLQAEDRMRCLLTVKKLFGQGMEITTYGNGRIGVVCAKAVRNLIPQAARESGLLYPASLPDLTVYPANKTIPLHVQQHLISAREFARNVQVDKQCLKELEQATNAFKSSAK